MAAMSASKSTPNATVALLKQAIRGTSPWLNAPKIGFSFGTVPPFDSGGVGHAAAARAFEDRPLNNKSIHPRRVRFASHVACNVMNCRLAFDLGRVSNLRAEASLLTSTF